jgi:hypothetical protein
MRAFILGNGESRSKVSVSRMAKHGFIYGCNAIYRDFRPDILITVDPAIAKEIQKSGYMNYWKVFTPYKDIADTHKNFVLFQSHERYCAGVTACMVAIHQGCKELILIGHDLGSNNGLVNNCYKNSNNYKQAWEDDDSYDVYSPHYITLLQKYPAVSVTRVMAKQSKTIKEFKKFAQYHETKMETFVKHYQ